MNSLKKTTQRAFLHKLFHKIINNFKKYRNKNTCATPITSPDESLMGKHNIDRVLYPVMASISWLNRESCRIRKKKQKISERKYKFTLIKNINLKLIL